MDTINATYGASSVWMIPVIWVELGDKSYKITPLSEDTSWSR